jgi:oligoribonuclease NrnB/cAMP/cGMP phosphodiesterase (DHH superfamily)
MPPIYDLIIYHDNCFDGYGARFAAELAYGKSAEYFPAQHGRKPPDVSGKSVLIADFSYPKELLLEMKKQAKVLYVVDHHISAQEDLKDLDFCFFNTEKSGAVLAWEHIHGDDPVPQLLLYIQDRDLWKFKMPSSKDVMTAVASYEKSFESWSSLAEQLETHDGLCSLCDEGRYIQKSKDIMIESIMKKKFEIKIDNILVPCVNSPIFQSEIGNILSEESPFAAVYYYDGDKFIFSLRSKDSGEDVSKIAKKYGGGGHRNAAGFSVKEFKHSL